MTWVAWRQFRTQGLVALAALVLGAVFLGITGSSLHDLFTSSGLAKCARTSSCGPAEASFLLHDPVLRGLLKPLALVIPGIVGVFWGAPLVARELESGTYRLAWTQGVSRNRWLAIKVALVGFAAILVTELFSLMLAWWYGPVEKLSRERFSPGVFDFHGIVPIGYAAVAFSLGLLLGTVIRRAVPAMACTLIAFIGVRLAGNYWLRPHLGSARHFNHLLDLGAAVGFQVTPSGPSLFVQTPNIANAWVLSAKIANNNGTGASEAAVHNFIASNCPGLASAGNSPPPESLFRHCAISLSGAFHETVSYLPAGEYWTVQALELIAYLVLSALIIALCFWWIGRGVRRSALRLPPIFGTRRSRGLRSRAASPGAL